MNAVPRGPPTGVDDGDSSRRPTGVDGDVTRDVPERSRCPRFGFCTVDGLRLAVRLKCRTSLASVLPVHVRTRHTRVHVARSTADSAGPYPARGARTDRQVRAGDHARGPRLHLATRAGERGRFVRGGKAGLDIRCRTRTSRGATHRVGAARNAARAPRLARSDHTYREGARHGERDAGVRGASEGDRRLHRPHARGVRRCRPSRTECRGHDLVARRHRGRDRAHREQLRLTMRDAIANLPGAKIRELANVSIGRDDVLAFWCGESDDVTPEPIREAAITSLRRGETFYASNLGLLALREAIARYVSSLHRPCDASRIAVTSSGVSGLMIAMQALAGPGDEVVAVVPVRPNLTAQPEILGARVKRVPLVVREGGWTLDLAFLLASISDTTRAPRQRAEQPARLDPDSRRAAGAPRALPPHRHVDHGSRGLRAAVLRTRARGAELPRHRRVRRSARGDQQLLEVVLDDGLAARLDGGARGAHDDNRTSDRVQHVVRARVRATRRHRGARTSRGDDPRSPRTHTGLPRHARPPADAAARRAALHPARRHVRVLPDRGPRRLVRAREAPGDARDRPRARSCFRRRGRRLAALVLCVARSSAAHPRGRAACGRPRCAGYWSGLAEVAARLLFDDVTEVQAARVPVARVLPVAV